MYMEEQTRESGLKVVRYGMSRSEVADRVTEELKKLRKSVRMPGFRPGRVPLSLLRKLSGDKIEADLVQEEVTRLQQEHFAGADGPEVLLPWSLEKAALTDEGMEIVFVALPTPEAPLTVDDGALPERIEVEMTEADVDAEVEEIRKNYLSLAPLEKLAEESPHPQRFMSEVVELDEEGRPLEGGVRHSAIFMWEELPEGLRQELAGKEKGASVVTDLRAHFEGKEEELAALLEQEVHAIKDLSSKVELRNIVPYMIVLPEVNEAFIKKVYPDLEAPTEEKFRERARLNAVAYWNRRARRHWERQLTDRLLEDYDASLPAEGVRAWYAATFRDAETAEKLLNDAEWRQLKWGTAVRNRAKAEGAGLDEKQLRQLAQTYAYREAMEERKAPTNEFLAQRMGLYLYHPYYRYLLHTDGWEERFFEAMAEKAPVKKMPLSEFKEMWARAQRAAAEEATTVENSEDHETE